MQLHDARRAKLSNKKKIRVGRGPGSGLGKTAGRGIKGATSRSGYAMKVTYEGGQMPLFRRLPKRGFVNGPFRKHFSVINVGDLAAFPAGSKVGVEELRKARLVRGPSLDLLKILGEGELKVALTVVADGFSQSAIDKIQKAGGKIEWIGGAPKKEAPNFKKIEEEKRKKAAAEKAEKGEKPLKRPPQRRSSAEAAPSSCRRCESAEAQRLPKASEARMAKASRSRKSPQRKKRVIAGSSFWSPCCPCSLRAGRKSYFEVV